MTVGNLVDESQPFAPHALHFVSHFSLRNACIAWYNTSTASHRAQFISPDGLSAVVHGFSEHSFRYSRITTVRAGSPVERAHMRRHCVRRPLGLAIYFQSNNLFHAMFHAPPAWHQLAQFAHETQQPPTFIPLVGYIAGRTWAAESHWHVAAWELLVRALTKMSPQEIAQQLQSLLSARCTCFDRVEGSTGYFSPASRQPVSTRPVLGGWRANILAHLRTAERLNVAGQAHTSPSNSFTAARQILFIARNSRTRVLVNQDAAFERLRREFGPHLHAVAMEHHLLSDQIRIIASTKVLIGVHGQALALMVFLPLSPERSALVEIKPVWAGRIRARETAWHLIYDDWSSTLGVGYFPLTADVDTSVRSCRPAASRKAGGGPLRCNVSVSVGKLEARVKAAVRFTDGGADQ